MLRLDIASMRHAQVHIVQDHVGIEEGDENKGENQEEQRAVADAYPKRVIVYVEDVVVGLTATLRINSPALFGIPKECTFTIEED